MNTVTIKAFSCFFRHYLELLHRTKLFGIRLNSLDIVQDLLILFFIISAVGMYPCVTELLLDVVLTTSEFIHSPLAF